MRIPMKLIMVSIGTVYGIAVTKMVYDKQKHISKLEKKLCKQKKNTKKYNKELQKPIYRRTVLPRNAKPISKHKPKNPIGFA